MCGIYGWLRLRGAPPPPAGLASAMDRAVAGRGPDGAARWAGDGALLGLRRLAISAPDEAPRVHSARGVRAVMNGEILNHLELRAELERGGTHVAEGCDSALIPELYLRDGPAFIDRLRGFYAIALFDEDRGELHLYRDALGKKPLYLRRGPDGVSFASLQKALLAGDPAPKPRPEAVMRFLMLGWLSEDDLLVSGPAVLPPGTHLRVTRDGRFEQRRFRSLSSPAARWLGVAGLSDALRHAVDARARADVPAALLLSGGLDSSTVAAAAGGRVRTAYVMRVAGHDETAKAEAAARALGLELRVHDIPAPAWPEFRSTIGRLEHPDSFLSYGVAFALGSLAGRLRADGFRVALSGQGADEVFLGYPWDALAAAAETGVAPRVSGLAGATPSAAADAFREARRGLERRGMEPTALQAFLTAGAPGLLDLCETQGLAVLREDLRAGLAGRRPLEGLRRPSYPRKGPRSRQLDGLLHDIQPGPILQSERVLMAGGVEERMPFLDEAVVAQALAAPESVLESASVEKPLLREAARLILPAGAASHAKRGFYAPEAPSLAVLRRAVPEIAAGPCEAVDPRALSRFARDAEEGRGMGWALLWRLVLVETALRGLLAPAQDGADAGGEDPSAAGRQVGPA